MTNLTVPILVPSKTTLTNSCSFCQRKLKYQVLGHLPRPVSSFSRKTEQSSFSRSTTSIRIWSPPTSSPRWRERRSIISWPRSSCVISMTIFMTRSILDMMSLTNPRPKNGQLILANLLAPRLLKRSWGSSESTILKSTPRHTISVQDARSNSRTRETPKGMWNNVGETVPDTWSSSLAVPTHARCAPGRMTL